MSTGMHFSTEEFSGLSLVVRIKLKLSLARSRLSLPLPLLLVLRISSTLMLLLPYNTGMAFQSQGLWIAFSSSPPPCTRLHLVPPRLPLSYLYLARRWSQHILFLFFMEFAIIYDDFGHLIT